MRFARYHPPHAAPPTATRNSSASKRGETRGFCRIIVVVRGRAMVGTRAVAGICAVPGAALFGSGICVSVRGGMFGFGTPDIVAGAENVERVSRLKARSRAD